MIEIKPHKYSKFSCPECKSDQVIVNEITFPGLRILADCNCKNCNLLFFHDLPVGHALFYPMSIRKDNAKVFDEFEIKWMTDGLKKTINAPSIKNIKFRKKVNKICGEKVIIINCIDYLYGHVILKLINVQYHLKSKPDIDIIVIIPSSFEWMVPDYVAEIWMPEIKLSQAKFTIEGFHNFITEELKRFNQVFISPAYSHPDLFNLTIEDFTKVPPFKLENFNSVKPVFTFIYREDRVWSHGIFDHYLFLASQKLNLLHSLKRICLLIQNWKAKMLFKFIRRQIPDAEFNVVGLGKFGRFPSFINDLRETSLNAETEREWCKIYSRSTIVIGIHGSNMLLPTAHSAGFIEILPEDRFNNITQDVFPRYESRIMLFLGRFIGEFSSSSTLAKLAVSMVRIFPYFNIYENKELITYDEVKDMNKYQNSYAALKRKTIIK